MAAVAKLAAAPSPLGCWLHRFLLGWMYAGFPIMYHLDSVKELVNMEYIQANVLWGPIHELGHNQQWGSCEFPPHTIEATCNLWSVYVHEKVLGFPDRELTKSFTWGDWSVWILLEAFGWEPLVQLFSDDQKMSNIPTDNPSKMNLWAENFSQQVKKNLAPFFRTWGWSIKVEVSKKLESLPNWDKNPRIQFPHKN
uniref:Peptidase M60 domain-containing protein n=1 Tax=Chrysemys picta bellii TaxID=8478 RepID=A0A8C3IVK4_CHRPI